MPQALKHGHSLKREHSRDIFVSVSLDTNAGVVLTTHPSSRLTDRELRLLLMESSCLSYVIGIYRSQEGSCQSTSHESQNKRYTCFFFFFSFFFFFRSLIVLPIIVIANTLTELSWLDMDVWWDIGNCDLLARWARIP